MRYYYISVIGVNEEGIPLALDYAIMVDNVPPLMLIKQAIKEEDGLDNIVISTCFETDKLQYENFSDKIDLVSYGSNLHN